MLKKHMKKIIALLTLSAGVSIVCTLPARAQGDFLMIFYLENIMKFTYGTLVAVNNLPNYLQPLTELSLAWLSPDKSETTANLQSNFASITDTLKKNSETQSSLLQRLQQDYFGPSVTKDTLPFVNDLTYSTLMEQPYLSPDPRQANDKNVNPTYNYLKNAAGLTINHPLPNTGWAGTSDKKQEYINYYSTISAVQTFNGYLLAQLYTNNQLSKSQTSLIEQASSSDWFTQVATEDIGIVLRQLLMYNSQVFVMLTQLLQAQRQQLAAQAMSNTMLILNNQNNETMLIKGAQGTLPPGS